MNMRKDEIVTLEVETPRGIIEGLLYPSEEAIGAMVMVGGAGGGLHGPAGIYEPLAERLQAGGVTALRLEYRQPNDIDECTYDVLAAVEGLSQHGTQEVVLLGWSFGGAVAINAGALSQAVVGVATVASQTYGAHRVNQLAPKKNLLLIHGTADNVLSPDLSRQLYTQAGEPKELVLYPGDNHGISDHAQEMLDKLYNWTIDLLLDEE